MSLRSRMLLLITLFTGMIIVLFGCSRDSDIIGPAPFPANAEVFVDEFGSSVTFQAFLGSKLDAVQLDQVNAYAGSQALIVTVPDSGDASGSYAGGAFTTGTARNLSGYNALSFWAKASRDLTLDVVGIGNDNTGTSRYTAELQDLQVTSTYSNYLIPIPDPGKLTAEQGMFFFAEGPEGGVGATLWFDEIQFVKSPLVSSPSVDFDFDTMAFNVGEVDTLDGFNVLFDIGGTQHTVAASSGYLSLVSSNTGIVSIPGDGIIAALAEGTAEIDVTVGSSVQAGTITATVFPADAVPDVAAPTPALPSSSVISLFSDVYTDVAISTWSPVWDNADVIDTIIASDNVKKYTNLVVAGIEFNSPTVDASSMTHFHMDIWTPNVTSSPNEFAVKLVDFGDDGVFSGPGSDDREHELAFDVNSSPPLESGTWVSIDVPLSAFSGLTTKGHLAQIILSGDLTTVYVDNIYLYEAAIPTEPSAPASIPSQDPGDVISLFSDAYTNVTVDTWSAPWDTADVADVLIGSDNVKKYTGLLFAGIEFTSATIDASLMTHFRMDVWTPDFTGSPAIFKIKLVDFGPDGSFQGGDDTEHELTLDYNTMRTGEWVYIDLPLTAFTGLTTKGHLAQLIISGDPNTVFVDNVYLYNANLPTEPPDPAPTPSVAAADVISLYSDEYTNIGVDTWSAVWDQASVEDFLIGSDNVKKYTNLKPAGIEFRNNQVDATTLTHFHIDVWTPDPTSSPAEFSVTLVDFGANGISGGGDDVQHKLTFDENTMNTGSWVSIEVPLSDFTGLTTRANLAQLIINADPNTVFVDNIYLHK